MSDSVYRKTPLPVKLNLNDRNTAGQLKEGNPASDSWGSLDGVGPATLASQSLKNCTDVMHKHLQEWLHTQGMKGPPPSAEAEQRAMWAWIREFHKEYNDDWFSRNMPRLHEKFKPIFVDEMKSLKAATAATSTGAARSQATCVDLLDYSEPASSQVPSGTISARPQAENCADLLSMDANSGTQGSAQLGVQTASISSVEDSLLDLNLGPSNSNAAQPVSAQVSVKQDGNLLDLMM